MFNSSAICADAVPTEGIPGREALAPEVWDAFLQSSPQGQFQQSSMWGDFKATEGWTCRRVVAFEGREIIGGCQVLMKTRRGARIGYISKGPVLREETVANARAFWKRVQEVVRRERLHALLIQPPDNSEHWSAVLPAEGCLPATDFGIINSTFRVDLSGGPATVEARYPKTTQQRIRKSIKLGVSIREAGAAETGSFFRFMNETCQRKGVSPNPASASAFGEMYRVLAAGGAVRMTLAELGGVPLAGVFCIRFGATLTLWKKGSTKDSFRAHAMDLLYHDALAWGSRAGFATCDFGGIAREIAETVLAGRDLSEAQNRSNDVFNMRFGGRPALLPSAVIYVPIPVLRWGLKKLLGFGAFRRIARRALRV